MTKAPISLQDLRKSLYIKAKAEPTWRFWGLYVHVCKMETLQEAYQMAKSNDGAPGIDGVTFEAIDESGVEIFLKQIQDELVHNTYQPMRVRKKEIPKDGGSKVRVLSIPAIRDRVVQGALKRVDHGLEGTSPSEIGPINLDRKQAGKPSAGKQHAGFDAAGAGNQLTVWIMRHSQRKRRDPARLNLRSMAPVLDPTTQTACSPCGGVQSTQERSPPPRQPERQDRCPRIGEPITTQ